MTLDELVAKFDSMKDMDARDLYAEVVFHIGHLSVIERSAVEAHKGGLQDISNILEALWHDFEQINKSEQSRRRLVIGMLQQHTLDAESAGYAAYFGINAGLEEKSVLKILRDFLYEKSRKIRLNK